MNTKHPFYCMVVLFATLFILACEANDKTSDTKDNPSDTAKISVTAQKIYEGLMTPWGLAWLPDGRLLITEKSGEILIFKDDKYTGEKISGLPKVSDKGQGGLLDIKLHPDYKKNGWIYISYSKPVDNGMTTAIARFKLKGNQVTDFKDLFLAKPILDATYHFGSRIVFDKNNYLFFSSGERGTQPKVWELNNDHGKIHRLYDDGRVPDDNPYVGQAGANPSIWTIGHRNPQGMVYDAKTDRIWAIEHGPKGGDELNLIEKGKNYGWPKTCYGINYDGTILTEFKEMEGVTNPTHYWVPSIAPCGMTIVTSDRYPAWKGNLLAGALALRHLNRIQLNGTSYVGEERLFQDMARFRCVAESPDGYIYAVTEGPGMLLKLIPNK
jgi:aldose sugar dehydrogenase